MQHLVDQLRFTPNEAHIQICALTAKCVIARQGKDELHNATHVCHGCRESVATSFGGSYIRYEPELGKLWHTLFSQEP